MSQKPNQFCSIVWRRSRTRLCLWLTFAVVCLLLGTLTVREDCSWSATLREWHPRVLAGSGLLGLCLLITWFVWADRRWEIAEIFSGVALVFAVSCVVAGLLASDVCLTLPMAGVALLLSIRVLIMATARPYVVDPRLCDACGYNLAANVSGVCPECGTPIPDEQRAACIEKHESSLPTDDRRA
jgi:hypothetical protein